MSAALLVRWCGLAAMVSGVLFALFFLLHPGGGDPTPATTILGSPYAAEHTLGVVATILMLFGLVGLYARQIEGSGWLGFVGFVVAIVGTALIEGVIYLDGSIEPIMAAQAPALLADQGPLNTMPGVLAFAIPGVTWGLGIILFGIASLRAGILPRGACALLVLSAVWVNIPPQPIGPAPLFLIVIGAMVMGVAWVWLGFALWQGSNAGTMTSASR